MGVGLVFIVDADQVDAVMDAARATGETPYVIGRIEDGMGIVRYENVEKLYA